MARFQSVDAYIASFPPDVQLKIEFVREAIRRAVPGSEEAISYDIAAFTLHGHGYLALAGWKRHISIYPIPHADPGLDRELTSHKSGKGTLQFPLSKPIPLELVSKVATLLADQRAGSSAPAAADTSGFLRTALLAGATWPSEATMRATPARCGRSGRAK